MNSNKQKRVVRWSNAEWKAIQAIARREGLTASAYIRRRVSLDPRFQDEAAGQRRLEHEKGAASDA